MKTSRYQKRSYRCRVTADDLYSAEIAVLETDVQVLTDKPVDVAFLRQQILHYRQQIEYYITRDPRFLTALKPIAIELGAPAIVKRMAQASRKAGVGPMASVAGAIAEYTGRDLLRKGYRDVIIENGGDIFLRARSARYVGVYAGPSQRWQGLRLVIRAKDTPVGICTSSGTLGHSLSFGRADSAVVIAKNATLADAVATATGNMVQAKSDLERALSFAHAIPGVLGVLIILGNTLASRGTILLSPAAE
jgi:hypothetical protein